MVTAHYRHADQLNEIEDASKGAHNYDYLIFDFKKKARNKLD